MTNYDEMCMEFESIVTTPRVMNPNDHCAPTTMQFGDWRLPNKVCNGTSDIVPLPAKILIELNLTMADIRESLDSTKKMADSGNAVFHSRHQKNNRPTSCKLDRTRRLSLPYGYVQVSTAWQGPPYS
jgi:hypothetical protein